MDAASVHRPNSIRSVASNSSLASGVSLSRRSRTRTRSRTLTGGLRTHGDANSRSRSPLPPNLPYFAGTIVHEPLDDAQHASQHDEDALSTPPPSRPPRSPQRLQTMTHAVDDLRSIATSTSTSLAEPTIVEATPSLVDPTQSTALSTRPIPSKAATKASSLPHLDTGYKLPHPAFSRDPSLTPVVNVRDSVSTQQSGMSSSLYPPSTTTSVSLPSSPSSPRSMATTDLDMVAPPFALEVNEVHHEYDSDDVSYRLRLLVKNNYFLPPAHSKPSAADFSPPPSSVDQAKKSPTTFLDIFRKSKSKPTTPTGTNFNAMAPMLRTTSDSITAPYALRQPPVPNTLRTTANTQYPIPPHSAPPTRGRVVVVREKMHDIPSAARQAEQDLKTRHPPTSHPRSASQSHPVSPNEPSIIDPTDAVDLPLPSPSYPFPVQTSALHGLGVLESLGAAVLADHLPPGAQGKEKAKNPNLSVEYDEVEDSWRKAILQQAVHCSYDNTPDDSTMSMSLVLGALGAATGSGTPLGSPGLGAETSRAGASGKAKVDGKEKIKVDGKTSGSGKTKADGNGAEVDAKAEATKKMISQKIAAMPPSSPTSTSEAVQTPSNASNTNSNPRSQPPSTSRPAPAHTRQKSTASASASTSKKPLNLSLPTPDSTHSNRNSHTNSTYMHRAETPLGPMTPLGPPPRRGVVGGCGSGSGSAEGLDLEGSGEGGRYGEIKDDGASTHSELLLTDLEKDETRKTIRRTVSSPSFGDGHEYDSTGSRAYLGMAVPPVPLAASTGAGDRSTGGSSIGMSGRGAYTRDSHATFASSSSQSQSRPGTAPEYEMTSRELEQLSRDMYSVRGGSFEHHAYNNRHSHNHAESLRSTMLSRPSLSEYSQASQSPTTSVFQEMLNRNSLSAALPGPGPARYSFGVEPEVERPRGFLHAAYEFSEGDSSAEANARERERARARAMGGTISPPPPRLSSSLAHNALPPPPRSTSFNYSLLTGVGAATSVGMGMSMSGGMGGGAGVGSGMGGSGVYGASNGLEMNRNQNPELHIYAPEPSSPPLPPSAALHDDLILYNPGSGPSSGSRSNGVGLGSNSNSNLDANADVQTQGSTTSFFDSIQGQPNAMDDLESSDEESGSEVGREDDDDVNAEADEERRRRALLAMPPVPVPSSVLRPRSRATSSASEGPARPGGNVGGVVGMRHGNASAPYIRGGERGDYSQSQLSFRKGGGAGGIGMGNLQPVTNVVSVKASKQDILSSSDFFRYAMENPPANASTIGGGGGGSGSGSGPGTSVGHGGGVDSRRPSTSTADHGTGDQDLAAWRSSQRAQESLRKLDGMLLKHMVDEKDTIKRIATTLTQSQQSKSAPPSAYPF